MPDLILMDVRMPRMDGFTACRLLAADPLTCAIPVIFLTVAGALHERLEGFDIGCVDYVVKPFGSRRCSRGFARSSRASASGPSTRKARSWPARTTTSSCARPSATWHGR